MDTLPLQPVANAFLTLSGLPVEAVAHAQLELVILLQVYGLARLASSAHRLALAQEHPHPLLPAAAIKTSSGFQPQAEEAVFAPWLLVWSSLMDLALPAPPILTPPVL